MQKQYINLLTWFPFIGWMLPIAFNNRDDLALDHGKQAMYTALFAAVFLIIVTFTSLFMPRSSRSMRLAIVILFYLVLMLYFIICGIGTFLIKKERKGNIPFIKGLAEKLDI